ncbi:MAG TPA: NAD(P)H-dependent oxidoreductase [Xanthobacteraceae bacterium]|nr:NAD(P)H-dependent oxidoreductase [Xanthobacteraceae bacterium]
MAKPRILVFAGSIRTGAFSQKLAAFAAKELSLLDADTSFISLADYPMPLYDGDYEAREGAPENARKLRRMILAHRGVFIATPEYNASTPPLLKNALDWVSRAKEPAADPFKGRYFAIGSTSNGRLGGYRALIALRQVLELGLGALVLPEQVAVSEAAQAFDDGGGMRDGRVADFLRAGLRRLIALAESEL